MDGFLPDEVKNRRSQDLPKHYRLNGAIYACRTEVLLREGSFLPSRRAFAYVMPRERSVDVDDALDLSLARCILEGVPTA